MNNSTYTGHLEHAYMVEGRKFFNYGTAHAFAGMLAEQAGRVIRIMEKVPGLPWHVIAEVSK